MKKSRLIDCVKLAALWLLLTSVTFPVNSSAASTQLYGVGPGSPYGLFEIDQTDGTTTLVSDSMGDASAGYISDIAFGPDGLLYGNNRADVSEGLVVIDPETGKTSNYLPYSGLNINYNSVGPIAFSPDGELYIMSGGGRLSTVNLITGGTNFLAQWAIYFSSIAFSPDGILYAVKEVSGTNTPNILVTIFQINTIGDTHGGVMSIRFSEDGERVHDNRCGYVHAI